MLKNINSIKFIEIYLKLFMIILFNNNYHMNFKWCLIGIIDKLGVFSFNKKGFNPDYECY